MADVLLYAGALLMELAALVVLRRREPELRGAFRLPFGVAGVTALALLPGIPLYRWRAARLRAHTAASDAE